jgi:hypothetical protein
VVRWQQAGGHGFPANEVLSLPPLSGDVISKWDDITPNLGLGVNEFRHVRRTPLELLLCHGEYHLLRKTS